MNNVKWIEILEWLRVYNLKFEIELNWNFFFELLIVVLFFV